MITVLFIRTDRLSCINICVIIIIIVWRSHFNTSKRQAYIQGAYNLMHFLFTVGLIHVIGSIWYLIFIYFFYFFAVMMFPVALLLEKKLLPDGGRNSYYPGVSNYDKTTLLFTDFVSVYLTHVTRSTNFAPFLSFSGDRTRFCRLVCGQLVFLTSQK